MHSDHPIRTGSMAKILIVDDEPRIRELIREHLEHEGFQCEEATDGSAALAALAASGADLVILDIICLLYTSRCV